MKLLETGDALLLSMSLLDVSFFRNVESGSLFYSTPLGDSNLFEPVHFQVNTSEIIYLGNRLKWEIVIAIISGLSSGIIFVFLLNVIRNRRVEE